MCQIKTLAQTSTTFNVFNDGSWPGLVSAVAGHAHTVVDVHLGGVGQVQGLLHREFVGDFAELNDVLGETECGSDHMALESEGEHF